MIRYIVLLVLLAPALFAQNSANPMPASSRVISVTDKHGNPVNVTSSDLRVTVDKVEVTNFLFTPLRERRLTAVVLLDYSGSMRDKETFAAKSARDAVEVLSGYGSKPGLCVFNEKRTCNIRAEEVLSQLARLHPNGSDNLSSALDSAEILMAQQVHQENTPFLRTIVLITDGDLKDIPVSKFKADNVVVFPIGLLGPPNSISGERKKLIELASVTEGRVILLDSPGDVQKQFKRVLDSEYEIVFAYPGGVTHPQDIRIETKRSDWRINPN